MKYLFPFPDYERNESLQQYACHFPGAEFTFRSPVDRLQQIVSVRCVVGDQEAFAEVWIRTWSSEENTRAFIEAMAYAYSLAGGNKPDVVFRLTRRGGGLALGDNPKRGMTRQQLEAREPWRKR